MLFAFVLFLRDETKYYYEIPSSLATLTSGKK